MSDDGSVSDQGGRRWRSVFLAGAVVVAAVGYMTGTRHAEQPRGYQAVTEPVHGAATAPPQAGMESARYADRRATQLLALESMRAQPGTGAEAPPHDPVAYAQAAAARREARAYDGAPPTIPHAVDQHGAPACLACHAEGMRVEGRAAPLMSHERFDSCLQCHALAESPLPRSAPLAHSVSEVNSFLGLTEPERGERAWPGAPPTMPHRTFMRERCDSCHGTQASGLTTSHPWRQSCPQCHAPSATLDQRPRSTLAPLPGLTTAGAR
ncbi:MAG: nitrate reductase cytochrome c-type subunit [Polyangiales bacterium]|nr:nitrate reductase cytochrome c-type subunit [Myxococcales bacterium]MCB9660986.1 nitrate reductase cytochrome c-type subunit [Sandaracinaceae bacterium]